MRTIWSIHATSILVIFTWPLWNNPQAILVDTAVAIVLTTLVGDGFSCTQSVLRPPSFSLTKLGLKKQFQAEQLQKRRFWIRQHYY